MTPPDKPDLTKMPVPNLAKHERSFSEAESHGQMDSQEPKPRFGAIEGYLSEENMERFGRQVRIFAGQSQVKAEKFVQEDLRDLAEWAEVKRGNVKLELKKQVGEVGPKAKQLGTSFGARIEHVQAEADRLAVTSKTHWEKVKQFLKKYRMAILIGLISLIFIATGHPEYILYTLLHLVMILFAAALAIIGILSMIFDNLFGIEFFSSIGDALYNITYAFYAPAYSATESVVIWLRLIHIFT